MSFSGILAILSSWIPTVFTSLAQNAVKVTLLLLLTGVAALALRKRSSAARHAIWCAALVAALVLPVLTLAVPEWKLAVLPAPAPAQPSVTAPVVTSPVVTSPAVTVPRQVHRHASVAPRHAPALKVTPAPEPVRAPAPAPAAPVLPRLPSLPALLLGLWVLGSCLVLARVVIGHGMLLHLSRHGRALHSASWISLAERAAEEAGLDRPFELLECDRIGVPATFGILRPVVLLPVAARDWPVERRRAVLVHELAHAARYDCLTQLMAQIACALYWYHPGVWWAERRMRVERESACDDRVLEGRMAASDYADHLIEVLREARRAGVPAFGAVAFARRSSLEGRLLALLDPRRDRRSPSRGHAWSAGLTTGALLLALAGAQLGAAPAPRSKARTPVTASTVASPGSAEVQLAPDTETDLANRWAWAVHGTDRLRQGGMWIGYELKEARAGGGHGLLSDSEGIDLALLNGHAAGPTLHDILARRGERPAGPPKADGVAILFHVTRGGSVDRVRTQSFSMPAPPGGQPIYWLGKAGDSQSLAWLKELNTRVACDPAKLGILDAASYHQSSESVTSWLGQVAESDAKESVRAEAAEGLGRHPTPASLRVLDKLARHDRSAEVRKSAIEALGQVDDPAAAAALFDIARSHDDVDVRKEAVETLGETVIRDPAETSVETNTETKTGTGDVYAYEYKMDVSEIEQGAKTLSEAGECLKKSAECAEKCKEKTKASCSQEAEAAARASAAASSSAPAIDDEDNDDSELAVQVDAVDALGHLPEGQALPRLTRIARTHAVPRVRREAVDAIGQFQSNQAMSALDVLVWSATDPMVQAEAVETYNQSAPGQQLSRLAQIARSHPRPEVRREAVDQMAQLDPQSVLPVLEGVVKSDDEISIKLEAVETLGGLPNQAGVPSLERIARSKLPARVRREALEALGKDDPSAALPVIEEILQDKQPTP